MLLLAGLAVGAGFLVAALLLCRFGRYPRTDAFGALLIGTILSALSTAILLTRLVAIVRGALVSVLNSLRCLSGLLLLAPLLVPSSVHGQAPRVYHPGQADQHVRARRDSRSTSGLFDGELRVLETGTVVRPNDLVIREYHRFERMSDLTTRRLSYVLESRDGIRGALADAVGVYAEILISGVGGKESYRSRR